MVKPKLAKLQFWFPQRHDYLSRERLNFCCVIPGKFTRESVNESDELCSIFCYAFANILWCPKSKYLMEIELFCGKDDCDLARNPIENLKHSKMYDSLGLMAELQRFGCLDTWPCSCKQKLSLRSPILWTVKKRYKIIWLQSLTKYSFFEAAFRLPYEVAKFANQLIDISLFDKWVFEQNLFQQVNF